MQDLGQGPSQGLEQVTLVILAWHFTSIGTEVKVEPNGTDLILRFMRVVIEQTLLH